MPTQSQINANRQNAQHSTGPVTESGKAKSSQNHLTLGLYTRQDYVKPEERDYYKEFCETMYHELNPAGLLEECLVSEITGATWRLRRCSNAEGELGDFDEATDKQRRSIERARASANSLLHRSINQLRKLQKEQTLRIVKTEKQADQATKQAEKAAKQAEKAEVDAMEAAVGMALSNIMNCPEPDWDAIDRSIAAERAAEAALASNCTRDAATAACTPTQTSAPQSELASNCEPAVAEAFMANLNKQFLPCACKSGIIYRNCCGKNEPRDWRNAA